MAKFRDLKSSFSAGEVSPTALGRLDIASYKGACKTLRNCIPLLSGGVVGRPGTFSEFGFNTTEAIQAPRIIPFIVSKTESYAMLFHNIVSPPSGNIVGYLPTTNTTQSTLQAVSGTHPYALGTSSNGYYDEIHDVQYVQSADVMTLVHPRHKPQRLTRSSFGPSTFGTSVFDNLFTGATYRDCRPYRPQNTTSTTIQIDVIGVGTGRVLTASAALFNSLHVGAIFKVDNAGSIGCAVVTGYTDSTHVTVEVKVAFGAAATPVATWWESSWSDYRGWPRAVGFFQQRQVYAGNISEPDSIWLSQTSNYDVMSISTILDPRSSPTGSQPFQITLSSQQLNQIQWVSADKTLAVGTSGDEFIVEREIESAGFGCDNAKATPQSHYGSSYNQPVRFGDELVFSLASGDELRSLVLSEFENTYKAEALQLLYDEFPYAEENSLTPGNRKYRTFAWDQSRDTLWCVDTQGNLRGLTRNRELQVTMWHSHQLGGYDVASFDEDTLISTSLSDPTYSLCDGSVVSLAVVPNPIVGTNDVWMVVKRDVDGVFVFNVERMIGKRYPFSTVYTTKFDHSDGNYHVDCANYRVGKYPIAEDYVFTGLDGVEGKIPRGTSSNSRGLVTITGSEVGTLSGGQTELTSHPPNMNGEVTHVELGLHFDSIIEPVRPEAGSVIGTAQGAIKRIHKVALRFYKTMACKIGRDADNLTAYVFREGSTSQGYSAELYTGDKKMDFEGDYDDDGYVYILKDQPLPFGVVAVISEGVLYD